MSSRSLEVELLFQSISPSLHSSLAAGLLCRRTFSLQGFDREGITALVMATCDAQVPILRVYLDPVGMPTGVRLLDHCPVA